MSTVVCMRWLNAFPVSYVRVLRNAVAEHLHRDHRFVCITDQPTAVDDDIETIPMPDLGIPLGWQKHGGWPKLSIFQPGLLPADEPTLYLDLDILVREGLDAFFDRMESSGGGFHCLREWNPTLWSLLPLSLRPDRGVQGSVLGFYPGEQTGVYERFISDVRRHCSTFRNEQCFLTDAQAGRIYWPNEWISSFKWHCLKYYPLNRLMPSVNEPRQAKLVVFHGDPRPIDVVPPGNHRWGTSRKFGFGPVDWVRDYWLRYDSEWTDEGELQPHSSAAA